MWYLSISATSVFLYFEQLYFLQGLVASATVFVYFIIFTKYINLRYTYGEVHSWFLSALRSRQDFNLGLAWPVLQPDDAQLSEIRRTLIWAATTTHRVFKLCSKFRVQWLWNNVKGTVQRELRWVKIGINRTPMKIWIAGKCRLPCPKGHHHGRSINILGGCSTFWRHPYRLGQ